MAVRPSMEYIITFVRELIQDPDDGTPQYTDQQIQDRLDLNRMDLYNDCLKPRDTRTTAGAIEWHDFFARLGFWETDFQIQEVNGTNKTADVAEPLIGKFHFNDHQPTPLMISGKVYNVYAVAATLMTMWISSLKQQITSWTADGTTITRIGQIRTMSGLADDYRSMAWGWGDYNQIKLVRKDLRN